MKEFLSGWYLSFGAVVMASVMGLAAGPVMAGASESGSSSKEDVTRADVGAPGFDSIIAGESVDALEGDALAMSQRYAPPPPRHHYYRAPRPYWRVRVVPPPIFAPGWFGFYFLGVQPPPPPPPVRTEAPQPPAPRAPDFRHVGQFSLGMNAGVNSGAYFDGMEYNDPGFRFTLGYRSTPVVGAELSVGVYGTNMRFDGQGSDVRNDIPIQASAILHAFPSRAIQPYFVFGATGDWRTYRTYDGGENPGELYNELRVGPHFGLGLELLVGQRASIVVDGRYVLYTLVDRRVADQTFQDNVSLTGGLNLYF